jgi:hypothetical protein
MAWRVKLDVERVTEIREALARGVSHRTIALEHGVTKACITHIARGRTWRKKQQIDEERNDGT